MKTTILKSPAKINLTLKVLNYDQILMKHKNYKPRQNWKPKQQQDKKVPQPRGREIPVINGNVNIIKNITKLEVILFILLFFLFLLISSISYF